MPKEAILEKIGLTKNESLVYLTLLQLGTSKTGEILKKSGLNSGKIYEILEALKVKGLVSESIINKVKHFTAAPPSQLLEYVERKREILQKEEENIRALLPELEGLRKITLKAVQAFTYIGFRGIKTAAAEALAAMRPDEEIVAMGITVHKDRKYNEFWKRWSKERIDKKINARHLFSEKSSYFENFRHMQYTDARVLKAITPVAIDIFGEDKVLILNYEEPASCILIYDKKTATSFRQFFEQLWRIAKS
jgi:sugar-specific transcriptional regulator TrmB